jgi:hypothetical protein
MSIPESTYNGDNELYTTKLSKHPSTTQQVWKRMGRCQPIGTREKGADLILFRFDRIGCCRGSSRAFLYRRRRHRHRCNSIVSWTQQRGSYFFRSRFFYGHSRSAAIDNGRQPPGSSSSSQVSKEHYKWRKTGNIFSLCTRLDSMKLWTRVSYLCASFLGGGGGGLDLVHPQTTVSLSLYFTFFFPPFIPNIF